jgi:AcrR family transcriptional regulator
MATTPTPSTRDQATEERILEAAHTVFLRDGTAGARMQEIAREAGVNHAMLHYYFRSKERLAEMVFRRAATEFFPGVLQRLATDAPLGDKVAAVIAFELEHLARHPYLPGYLISELTHHPERAEQLVTMVTGRPVHAVREGLLGVLRAQLAAEASAGRMRPISAEQFLVNLIALCVFPFAAQPMVRALLGRDAAGFADFIAERKASLPAFFLAGLRP